MIGSFWNLCRACPSMPIDKLHSEYSSTYRWHEFTSNSRPEVIKRPPATNQFGTINEPPLPRRKKCPELAYKTHEFIGCNDDANRNQNDLAFNRARSGERGTPSRRSKSEGPHRIANGQVYPIGDAVHRTADNNESVPDGGKAGESSGLFRKTISKLSTEYRIQFIWPHTRKDIKRSDEVDLPKKSLSMGAIKSAQSNAMPTVHKKRTTHEKEATAHELEPLVGDEKPEKKVIEPRKETRPLSHYANEIKHKHAHTERENFGFAQEDTSKVEKTVMNGSQSALWYRNVVELRKQAEAYRNRGWGIEMNPDLYNKQKDLWDQVSRRSSLSALSLASSIHKPITKKEKNAANTKRSSPTRAHLRNNSSQVQFIDNKLIHDAAVPGRVFNLRHHLGRTTGLDVDDGALLPSPIRDKLMPTIPKSKDDESYSSQRGSPKKSATSRHGSPQKGSPQKGSPQKQSATKRLSNKQNRSQSAGPQSTVNEASPKRKVRSGSAAPATATNTASKAQKKAPVPVPAVTERRPRPTSLSTSNHYRSKSSSLPPTGRTHSTPGNHQILNLAPADTNKLSPSTHPNLRKSSKITKHQRPQSAIVLGNFDPMTASTIIFNEPQKITGLDKKTTRNEDDTDKDGVTSLSSVSPLPAHEIYEHIVKSPPEPTRVKSPEQILMRSPDPVNWIVPLDTGKTFTVTQNVRDGDAVIRPQSEFKASTPSDKPPPAPLSAPLNDAEQAKRDEWNTVKTNENSPGDFSSKLTKVTALPDVRYDKPVPSSTLRRLDDPGFNPEANVPVSKDPPGASNADLEQARDGFDRFWGGNQDESK